MQLCRCVSIRKLFVTRDGSTGYEFGVRKVDSKTSMGSTRIESLKRRRA